MKPLKPEQATQRFYDLAWPHLAAVLRTARVLTGNSADAEDLAQETMLKAFRSIDRFREGTDARAWLMTILRRTRIDRLRASSSSAGTIVIDALRGLPEEIRWTLLLVDVEGMDHAEAAEILRVPVGTIKSRTHRGRAMLREALLPVARERRMVRD